MPKAYSYVRFSSPEQANGDSLRRQLARSRNFAEKRNLELDETLRDLGTPAFHNVHATKGHLASFLTLVRKGEIEPGSYFLIESFDRLSRDEFWPAFDLVRDLIMAGIIIVTLTAVDEPQEYDRASINKDPRKAHDIMLDLERGHRESKVKSMRCAEAAASQRAAARTGEVKIPGRTHAWLKPIKEIRNGRLATVGHELIPEAEKSIRRMFELALSGLGERQVAAQLNAEGVPGLTPGMGWHHSTVKIVMKSPAVIGIKQPGRMVGGKSQPDGEPLLDYYPRIISDGDYYRALSMRSARYRRGAGRKGATVSNLFSGLGRCAACGGALVYVDKWLPKRTPSSVYLMCTSARRNFGCTNKKHYHYDPLEKDALALLSLFDMSRLVTVPNVDAETGAALAAELEAKSERLKELAEFGNLAQVGGVIRKLGDDVKELQQRIEEHRRNAKVAQAEASRDAHAEFLRLVGEMRSGGMPEDELRLLRSKLAQEIRRIVEAVIGDGPALTIQLKTPPDLGKLELQLGGLDCIVILTPGQDRPFFARYPHRSTPGEPKRIVAFHRDSLLEGWRAVEASESYRPELIMDEKGTLEWKARG